MKMDKNNSGNISRNADRKNRALAKRYLAFVLAIAMVMGAVPGPLFTMGLRAEGAGVSADTTSGDDASEYQVVYDWPEQDNIYLDEDNEVLWSEDGVTLDESRIKIMKNGVEVTDLAYTVSGNGVVMDPGPNRIRVISEDGRLDGWIDFTVIKLIEDDPEFQLTVPNVKVDFGYENASYVSKKTEPDARVFYKGTDVTEDDRTDIRFTGNEQTTKYGEGYTIYFVSGTLSEDYHYKFYNLNGVSLISAYNRVETVAGRYIWHPEGMKIQKKCNDDGEPVSSGVEGGYVYYVGDDCPDLCFGNDAVLAEGEPVQGELAKHILYDDKDIFYSEKSEITRYDNVYVVGKPPLVNMSSAPKLYLTDECTCPEGYVCGYDETTGEYICEYTYCLSRKCANLDEWEGEVFSQEDDEITIYGDTTRLGGFIIVGQNFVYTGNAWISTGNMPLEVDEEQENIIKIGDYRIDAKDRPILVTDQFNLPSDRLRSTRENNHAHAYARYKTEDYRYLVTDSVFDIYHHESRVLIEKERDTYFVGEDIEMSITTTGGLEENGEQDREGSTGNLIVCLNDVYRYNLNPNPNTHVICLEDLEEGVYEIHAILDGDKYTLGADARTTIRVIRNDPTLTMTGKTPEGEAFEDGAEVEYDPEKPILINAVNDDSVSDTSWKWKVSDPDTVKIEKTENNSADNQPNSETIYLKTLKLGDAVVNARFSGNEKYNPKKATMSFTVVPMLVENPIIEVQNEEDIFFNRREQKPAVKVYYEEGKEIPADEYKVSYENNISATNENSKARVIVESKEGAKYSFRGEQQFEIQEALPEITQLPVACDIDFGQKLGDSSLFGGQAKVDGNEVAGYFAWKDPLLMPEVQDSQSTEFEVVFIPSDKNFLEESCGVKLTVHKVSIPEGSITAPKAIDGLTCSGIPQVLIEAGTVSGNMGTLYYTVTDSEATEAPAFDGTSEPMDKLWSTELPTKTNVGSYKIWYQVKGDANHLDPEGDVVSTSIEKGTPVITTLPEGELLQGQSLSENSLIGGVAEIGSYRVLGSFSWDDPQLKPDYADSDTTKYNVTFTPDNASNFTSAACQITVSVKCGVTFAAEQGATGSMEGFRTAQNATYTLPVSEFTAPEGKWFTKWSVKIGDADATLLDPGEEIRISDHTVITAVYKNAIGQGTKEKPWEIASWSDLAAAMEKGGFVKLTDTITFGEGGSDSKAKLLVSAGKAVTLDLNAQTLQGGSLFASDEALIKTEGTLTLFDGSEEGKGLVSGGIYVDSDAAMIVTGGTVSGNTLIDGDISVSGNTVIYALKLAENKKLSLMGALTGDAMITLDATRGVFGEGIGYTPVYEDTKHFAIKEGDLVAGINASDELYFGTMLPELIIADLAYDARDHAHDATLMADGEVFDASGYDITYWQEDVEADSVKNAGSYHAVITGKGDYVGRREATLTILKTMPTIHTLPKASDLSVGQTLSLSILTGGVAKIGDTTVAGTFTWKNASASPKLSDSNVTEYEVIFTPKDQDNLLDTGCKVKVLVKDVEPVVAETPAGDKNPTDAKDSKAGTEGGGSVDQKPATGVDTKVKDPTVIEAGAFKNSKATTVVIGKNIKTIKAGALKGSKVKTLVIKSKKLTRKSIKNALKGSKVKVIKVKVGKKKENKKYIRKYKKIFTKKIVGKKVIVK